MHLINSALHVGTYNIKYFMEVRELQLLGRKFTWSKNQNSPIMVRIDRDFATVGWEKIYKQLVLQPLSPPTSPTFHRQSYPQVQI
jgi:hypothetical protein